MNNALLIYHDDPDGWTSAEIAFSQLGNAELLPINHGSEFPWEKVAGGREVWMVDFSLQPFDQMVRLAEKAKPLVWIDHHISAIEERLAEAAAAGFNPRGIRRVSVGNDEIAGRGNGQVAGCELTWHFCWHGRPLPEAVRLIGRFDVGDWGDGRPLEFKYGFESEGENLRPGLDSLLWRRLLWSPDPVAIENLIRDGRAIKRWADFTSARAAERAVFDVELEGKTWLASNGSRGTPDPERHVGTVTFRYLGSMRKWDVGLVSLRPEEVSAAKIARKHGGGGHDAAAGFQVVELPFDLPSPNIDEWILLQLNGVR